MSTLQNEGASDRPNDPAVGIPDHIDPDQHVRYPTLAERTLSRELVYSGRFLKIRRDVARLPDGSSATREFVMHPGAAAMIAMDSEDRILIERQFRYAPGRVYIELPAGKRDPGETTFETAKRELAEETGYLAHRWAHLTTIHPAIGFADEVMDIYLARDLEKVERRLDDEEFVEIEWVTLGWLMDQLRNHRLFDVKMQLAVHWLDRLYRGEWPWPEFDLE
ncbi:MAG: NUDIX hydrolase [Lautropia sp.]|nr:NUDIX hydrolase [Lautropia sp.]